MEVYSCPPDGPNNEFHCTFHYEIRHVDKRVGGRAGGGGKVLLHDKEACRGRDIAI